MKIAALLLQKSSPEKVAMSGPARRCLVRSRRLSGCFSAAAVVAAALLFPAPASALSVSWVAPPASRPEAQTVARVPVPQLRGLLRVTPRELRHELPDVGNLPEGTPALQVSHLVPEEGNRTEVQAEESVNGSASSPTPSPVPSPVPAIRKGIAVTLTADSEFLSQAFDAWGKCRRAPLMNGMLGKKFVVVEVHDDDSVGLPSPDNSQNGTWYFPPSTLSVWQAGLATPANEAGSSGSAQPSLGILAGPHDTPFSTASDVVEEAGRFVNPRVATPQDTGIEGPAYRRANSRKVREVVSIRCMEKLHRDPHYVCPPEAYRNLTKATDMNVTQEEPCNATKTKEEEMHKQIEGLKKEVHALKEGQLGDIFDMKEESVNKAVNKFKDSSNFKHPAAEKHSPNTLTRVVPRKREVPRYLPFR